MSLELTILSLRLALILLLYLFLLQVVLVVRRDLRAMARRREASPEETQLLVLEGGQTDLSPGDSFTLGRVNSLGRSPTNSIPLFDTFVSTEHALLTFREGKWWLEDLGSTNGTFLNGQRVEQPSLVRQGDIVQIGGVRLLLERGS